ncbi:sensor domain-containing diguanylate cyclase [Bacilliculturomica massiliensis]|uniref:sensor domain-containing diguanylate cyclase n=1 Tax=Bacilliculturomica massiliensis TaxID=1917867 RepID=UPI0013EEED69|nr:diguanylate cyclase [Bacilliculturomica massiliensis]
MKRVKTTGRRGGRGTAQGLAHGLTSAGLIAAAVAIAASRAMWGAAAGERRKLQEERKRYETLISFSDTVLFEYDCGADTVEFTPNVRKLLNMDQLTFQGVAAGGFDLDILHPDDREKIKKLFGKGTEEKNGQIRCMELRMKSRRGEYILFSCKYMAVEDRKGGPGLILGKLEDITDQRRREKSLRDQAQTDALTGTYNKSGEEMIGRLLEKEGTGTLFMVDLDDFKEINDRYGHVAGDGVLVDVAAILRDMFAGAGVVARAGGDEFVAFAPGCRDRNTAADMAEQIVWRARAIQAAECGRVTVSVGVAVCPEDGTTFRMLYHAADAAMYAVKQARKDGWRFYCR